MREKMQGVDGRCGTVDCSIGDAGRNEWSWKVHTKGFRQHRKERRKI